MVSSGLYFALRIGFNSFSFLYNSTFHHFEASGAQSEGFDIETSSRYWTCLTCVDSHRIWRWNTTLALRDASVSNVGGTPRHCTDSKMAVNPNSTVKRLKARLLINNGQNHCNPVVPGSVNTSGTNEPMRCNPQVFHASYRAVVLPDVYPWTLVWLPLSLVVKLFSFSNTDPTFFMWAFPTFLSKPSCVKSTIPRSSTPFLTSSPVSKCFVNMSTGFCFPSTFPTITCFIFTSSCTYKCPMSTCLILPTPSFRDLCNAAELWHQVRGVSTFKPKSLIAKFRAKTELVAHSFNALSSASPELVAGVPGCACQPFQPGRWSRHWSIFCSPCPRPNHCRKMREEEARIECPHPQRSLSCDLGSWYLGDIEPKFSNCQSHSWCSGLSC